MRKNRVALLLNALSLTGAPKIALDAFTEIGNRLSLDILAIQGGPLIQDFCNLGTVTVFPNQSIRGRIVLPLVKTKVRIASALRKPDLIYVNSVAALPLLRQIGLQECPVLLHVHELDSQIVPFEREYADLLIERPCRYIAVSEAAKECLVKRRVDPNRVSVVMDFIRAEDFARTDLISNKKPEAPFIVGGSGFPGWCKGVQLWLEMAKEVARQVDEDKIRFVWVGIADNTESWQFREMARKLDIERLIDFLPITNDPLGYYKDFDVLTVTSWEESFSLVAVENMMLGKPVLCFANGATPEVVGDTGIVVPDFSPRLMADEVVSLMNSPERRRSLGEAAHKRAVEHFSATNQAARIYEEIQNVVGGRC